MKKIFEKCGVITCLGALITLIGAILLVVGFTAYTEVAMQIAGGIVLAVGILLLIIGIMKKSELFKNSGVVRCLGVLVLVASIMALIASVFVDEELPDMILKFAGIVLFAIGGMMVALTSKNHHLAKSMLVFLCIAVIMTWLYPYGYFNSTELYEAGMARVGLIDLGYATYYTAYLSIYYIIYLLVIGVFYGVLSKVDGYQKLTSSIAEKLKNHPVVSSVVISVIIFVLTSLLSNTWIVLVFIPFFISILLKMNLDKFSVFAITFGSLLVGILGCTYGTDSLYMFNAYINYYGTYIETTTGLVYRFIIAGIALVLYNFFIVMRVRKVVKNTKKNTKNNELVDDPFEVEPNKSKKISFTPVAVMLLIVAVVAILGYVDWNSYFGIEVFDEFHEWLTALSVGEDFTVISYLLGANATAFGEFTYPFAFSSILVLCTIVIAFLYKMSINEFIDSAINGIKKMFKPLLAIFGIFFIYAIVYMTPIIPSIANWLVSLVDGFNPYINTVIAFIASIFQPDMGYTSYTLMGLLTSYADNIDIVQTIYVSMYGMVQVFMPTSLILACGLSLMKISYKDWFKYIWLFVVGMMIILLVLFTVVTYV